MFNVTQTFGVSNINFSAIFMQNSYPISLNPLASFVQFQDTIFLLALIFLTFKRFFAKTDEISKEIETQ